ncbi:hypothetical protein T11_11205 [Trichinella zimbabwensis]|uniref:Uncharacterized protein n=1 Tax=Trichinella zimbabwensis TaxID=268475 RepID=A0A0V1HJB3_9BILA|nr:hypothetical protein T11_11205 [Trichinella zimbabwensis]
MQWQQNAGWLNRKKEEPVTNDKVSMRWEFAVPLKSNQMNFTYEIALAELIISTFSALGIRGTKSKLLRNRIVAI